MPQNVSIEGLNQILMIQNVASGLPSEQAVLDFVCRGLEDIPGAATVHCESKNTAESSDGTSLPDQHRFPIQIQGKLFSEIIVETDDQAVFRPYIPYINNLCFSIAVMLEERHLRKENSEYREKLETLVQKRTAQLSQQIREKEQAKKTALAEKDRAERYLDVAQAINIELDLNGNILMINQWGADLFKAGLEDLVGRNWFDLAYPETMRGEVRSLYDQFISEKHPDLEYYESTVVDFQGQEYTIAWHNALLRADDGSASGCLSFGLDISQRIEFEEKLRWELSVNEELAALGSTLIAPGQDITEVASRVLESACHLTGSKHGYVSEIDRGSGDNVCHTLTEMMGKDCTVTGPEQRIAFARDEEGRFPALWGHGINAAEPFLTNRPQEHPQSVGLPAGHIPLEQFLSVPVKYRSEVVGQIALANAPDGYDQRSIDAIQRLANLYALSINRQRAREDRLRMEQQLHQAQKIESVGRLAGGVAHDYNNMLGVIIGYAELAQMKLGPAEPAQDDLSEILNAAKRSRDITRQLLAFARKQTITPQILDLNQQIERTLKMLRNLLGENIDLVWKPTPNVWPVEIDPTQLDQILTNLCLNARDAIVDVGKMTIETKKVSLDQEYCDDHAGFIPGEFVMLAVSDDGCGMDKETLRHVFEPFFSTKESGEGTGLGLATIYGVVKQSNGFINVYSEPGKGTTFKIYLPKYHGLTEVEQDVPQCSSFRGNGKTVLVVEDELAILRLITTFLESFGFLVIAANSPSEALALSESHPDQIDMLLTDVVMPEMNGKELAGRIQLRYPQLKCLYMSGYTANVIAHHGILDEGIHFIHKPFSRSELSSFLKDILEVEA